jgi:hypothetical protein
LPISPAALTAPSAALHLVLIIKKGPHPRCNTRRGVIRE